MGRITVARTINASVEKVFNTVAHIDGFSKAIPHIVNVEFLSDQKTGVGTRFKETRLMRGKEASTVLEVTEYVANERIRLVSDAGGTIWDSVFKVGPTGEGTALELSMEARPYKLLSKLITPLLTPILSKALTSDMDAVKAYCEE